MSVSFRNWSGSLEFTSESDAAPRSQEELADVVRNGDEEVGCSHAIIARERSLKFEELEYFLPAEAGLPCFQEIRDRILSRHRKHVGWRVLFRLVARDAAWLSPMARLLDAGRETRP